MIHILIVDDEPSDIQSLESVLDRYAEEHGEEFHYVTASSAENLSQEKLDFSTIDLIILDIDMRGGINGIELARSLRKQQILLPLVFVTNFFQYAIQGYEVEAIDYILKPVEYESLSLKMDRILNIVQSKNGGKIVLRGKEKTILLDVADIVYVEVRGHYLTYHLLDGNTLVTRGRISDAESELTGRGFCLCNSYYLVNLAHVTGIEKQEAITPLGPLIVSKSKRKNFVHQLMQFVGGYR